MEINKHNAEDRLREVLIEHKRRYGTLYLSSDSLALDYTVQKIIESANVYMTRERIRAVLLEILNLEV